MIKKLLVFLSIISLSLVFALTNNINNVKADEDSGTSTEEEYSIDIKEENNLANWKYDWDIVNVGSAVTSFDSGHLKMENYNNSSTNYCLYETNKFNSFRLDMYANIYLLSPSDLGYEGNDWSTLYLTFFIDFEDAKAIDNVAQAACPWAMNKGWLSIGFQRINGQSLIRMTINEAFNNAGGYRYFLGGDENGKGCTVASTDWCDNEYHWFSIEVESYNEGRRNTQKGIKMTVYIDGVEETSYKQTNAYYSRKNLEDQVIPFDTAKGYIGFWASSTFDTALSSEDTGSSINIEKLQITSYDDVDDKTTATPYLRCEKPKFNLKADTTFSPQAGYEIDEDIEIKLENLFNYDGDGELTYTATCKGESIGQIRNGYFVWCPTEEGVYTVTIAATDGEISAENAIRLRINNSSAEEDKTTTTKKTTITTTASDDKGNEETPSGGCKSSVVISILSIIPILSTVVVLKKKKELE